MSGNEGPRASRDIKADVDEAFAELRRRNATLAATPVNVTETTSDIDLDDHVWLRVGMLVHGGLEVAYLPPELRAYFATRVFEQEYGFGGFSGFAAFGAEVADHVAPGYRLLGLPEAAAAFERLALSPGYPELLADHERDLGPVVDRLLDERAAAIGEHGEERLAFIRRHPVVFSI